MWRNRFESSEGRSASSHLMAIAREALDGIGVKYRVSSDKQLVAEFTMNGSHSMSLHMVMLPKMIDVIFNSGISYTVGCAPGHMMEALLECNQKLPFGAFRFFRTDDDLHVVCGAVVDPSIMDAEYIGRVVRDLADSTKQFVNAVKA
jgi:hypothetical protein